MSEFIDFDGERVPVPADIVSAGREAVAAWADQEARKRARRSPDQPPASGKE